MPPRMSLRVMVALLIVKATQLGIESSVKVQKPPKPGLTSRNSLSRSVEHINDPLALMGTLMDLCS